MNLKAMSSVSQLMVIAVAATSATAPQRLVAQQAVAAPEALATKGSDARVDYVVRTFGVTREQATEQLAVTDSFQPQINQLTKDFRDSYLKSIYNYGNPFSIDVVFSRDVAANELQQAVPADIRPHVKVKRSRFTRQEIMDGKKELIGALKTAFPSIGASFDFSRDRFQVILPDGSDQQNARSLVPPRLRTMVEFKKGDPGTTGAGFNTNTDDPTHNGKGSIWGGWPLRISTKQAVCSSNFIAIDTTGNQPQLLTAGHCGSGEMNVMWSDTTLKTMGTPLYRANGGGYDFQTRWGAFLTTSGYFWIDKDVSSSFQYDCDVAGNNCKTKSWRNLYGGVASNGYVGVTNATKGNYWSSYGWNDNHPVNDVVCKYGMVTGVSCGRVVDSEYNYEDEGVTYENFVRVLIDSSWGAGVSKGDSGGAVFKLTGTSGTFPEATAVGILSGGTFASPGTLAGYVPCTASIRGECHIIYMPIDRINDSGRPLAIQSSAGSAIAVD